jgi:hypothetical protein
MQVVDVVVMHLEQLTPKFGGRRTLMKLQGNDTM